MISSHIHNNVIYGFSDSVVSQGFSRSAFPLLIFSKDSSTCPISTGFLLLFFSKMLTHTTVPLGFLLSEIRVAFPGESQLQLSRATQRMVHAGRFNVSRIHRTLTRTTGSLTCAQMLKHAIAHGGAQTSDITRGCPDKRYDTGAPRQAI